MGFFWLLWVLPETKGLPLEEVAALMGDEDQVVVYRQDIHVDTKTHEVVLDTHEGKGITEKEGGTFSHVSVARNVTEDV